MFAKIAFGFVFLGTTACSAGRLDVGSNADAAPSTTPDTIVGTWDMTSQDGQESRGGPTEAIHDFMQLDFRADGSVTLRRAGVCSVGTYQYTDHHVKFSPAAFVTSYPGAQAGLVQFTAAGISIAYVHPTYFWGNFSRISTLPGC
jgi:hypothetical protein